MPVANSQRCEYVDSTTGKRCGRRATYFGDGQFCEGIGHEPEAPVDEIEDRDDRWPQNDAEEAEIEAIYENEEREGPVDFTDALDRLAEPIEFDADESEEPEPTPAKNRFSGILCECGCGLETLKGRIYLQGHDQRHKGILIREATIYGDDFAAELLIRKGWRDRAFIESRRAEETAKQERKLEKLNGNTTPKTIVVMEFEQQ